MIHSAPFMESSGYLGQYFTICPLRPSPGKRDPGNGPGGGGQRGQHRPAAPACGSGPGMRRGSRSDSYTAPRTSSSSYLTGLTNTIYRINRTPVRVIWRLSGRIRASGRIWGSLETVAQLWDLGWRADATARQATLSSAQYPRTAHPRGLRPARERRERAGHPGMLRPAARSLLWRVPRCGGRGCG
jgi:hypothetical protein